MTYSRCRCSFFSVKYSSLSLFPMPSSESIFGIAFDGLAFLCGAGT